MEQTKVPLKWTRADTWVYNASIGLGDRPADHDYIDHGIARQPELKAFSTLPLGMLHRDAPAVLAPWRPGAVAHLRQYADFDVEGLVHGEQAIAWARAPPAVFTGHILHDVTSIEQKSTGVVIGIRSAFVDASSGDGRESVLCVSVASMFLRGGRLTDLGRAASVRQPTKRPPRSALDDAVAAIHRVKPVTGQQGAASAQSSSTTYVIAPNQAVIYAMNSDDNPLHVDFGVAQRVKFPKPILHGLCTFGFVARAVEEAARADLGGGPTSHIKLVAMSLRFARPVFPGSELTVVIRRRDPASPGVVLITATTKYGDEKPAVCASGAAYYTVTAPKAKL